MTLEIDPRLIVTSEIHEALELFESGSHLFLTGKAGTGKSTLVRQFSEHTEKNLVVTAPTGVAALNVHGYTLHRLFSFQPGVTPEFVRSEQYFPWRFHRTLESLDTLIIDEASMVRADLFDCLDAALARFGPHPRQPFGGVQIVLVGDLYQLPPVVRDGEEEYFSTVYPSPYFFSSNAYDADRFPTVELTTVFRQEGDPEFLALLNSIRDGYATPATVEALNARVDEHFVPDPDENWLTLTTRNRIADARNRKELTRLDTELHTSTARIRGTLDHFDTPTQEALEFKVGAQIMLLTNDPQQRWVNGTLAVITRIIDNDGEYAVEVELRNRKRHVVEPHTWEITRPDSSAGVLHHEVIGTFRQLPFRLAWAVTIHKAQGLTLDRVIIDLAGGVFADGQLYVALSRATSLDGLVLTRPVRPRDLRVSQHIRRFLHTHRGGDTGEYAVVTAHVVGDDGWQWRPRPVELAVILADGTELTTLIDPQRDLGRAATTFDITAEDVVLAPPLPLAWAVLAPYLSGHIPVGINIAQTLEFVDYELKRHGHLIQLPIGVELTPQSSRRALRRLDGAVTALEKARVLRDLLDAVPTEQLPAATVFGAAPAQFGYLLPRSDRQTARFVVAADHHRQLADYLNTLVDEAKNSDRLMATLQAVEAATGHDVVPDDGLTRDSIDEVLQPGVTLCFTGQARHPADGSPLARSELEQLAGQHGLRTEDNLTKSRTDALIVAEFGTQSGKAQRARQWGKPIFSAEQFLAWTDGTTEDTTAAPDSGIQVELAEFPTRTPDPQVEASEDATDAEFAPGKTSSSAPSIDDESDRAVEEIPWTTDPIDNYLTPGAVVSVTGIIYHPTTGARMTQDDLARIMTAHDLRYASYLSQRTNLLLVGELTRPTGQLSAAIDQNKPLFSVADFLRWAECQHEQEPLEPPDTPEPIIQEAPPTPAPPGARPVDETVAPPPPDPEPAALDTPVPPQQYAEAPQPASGTPARPFWVRLSEPRFYGLTLGIPLGPILLLPILLAVIAAVIPALTDALLMVAAISVLIGFVTVPVAVVLIILRMIGQRRYRHQVSTGGQRKRS